MRKGILKPNAIAIASFEADFINPPTGKMTAKAAFINTESGASHGWTSHQIWSPSTLAKLKELKDSMEADLADAHFHEGGDEPGQHGPRGLSPTPPRQNGAGGLGEHLDPKGEDAEPIP